MPLLPLKFQIILLYLLFIALFWFIGISSLDPDYGWHLRMGELISKQGIPATDPFSYTMPSFPFIDHEWLTDILTAKLYPTIGINGLAVIYAIVATFALFIVIPKFLFSWARGPLLLSAASLFAAAGIRPQVISWLFFALLIRLLFEEKLWIKWRFYIPFLFCFWANIHGGFAIGITLLILTIFIKAYSTKLITKVDLGVLIFSLLATLLNPYGIRIWEEVFRTSLDASLRWTISEWAPAFFTFDLILVAFIAFSLALVWHYRKNITLLQAVLYCFLLLAGLTSKRQLPYWLLFNLPIISQLLKRMSQEVARKKSFVNFSQLYNLFLLTTGALLWAQSTIILPKIATYSEDLFYPTKAIEYLQTHPHQNELFAPYDWGGYLIWRLPQNKTFVDGRMPSWSQISSTKSFSAYHEYRDVVYKQDAFINIFEKYNVRTVLWRASDNEEFIKKLEKLDWLKIYQDEISVIYTKPSP